MLGFRPAVFSAHLPGAWYSERRCCWPSELWEAVTERLPQTCSCLLCVPRELSTNLPYLLISLDARDSFRGPTGPRPSWKQEPHNVHFIFSARCLAHWNYTGDLCGRNELFWCRAVRPFFPNLFSSYWGLKVFAKLKCGFVMGRNEKRIGASSVEGDLFSYIFKC